MKALTWIAGVTLGWVAFGLLARILAELFLLGWGLI
jgi:hypothetical protein